MIISQTLYFIIHCSNRTPIFSIAFCQLSIFISSSKIISRRSRTIIVIFTLTPSVTNRKFCTSFQTFNNLPVQSSIWRFVKSVIALVRPTGLAPTSIFLDPIWNKASSPFPKGVSIGRY